MRECARMRARTLLVQLSPSLICMAMPSSGCGVTLERPTMCLTTSLSEDKENLGRMDDILWLKHMYFKSPQGV